MLHVDPVKHVPTTLLIIMLKSFGETLSVSLRRFCLDALKALSLLNSS